MKKDLALKILSAILLASRRKIKKTTLEKFFSGFNLEELINNLNKKLDEVGFFVYEDKDSIELVNRPELSSYLINFFGYEENEIFEEFLEVLAIIAYGGPISLQKINRLRGKKSSLIIKELLYEGLIEKVKNNYQITHKFLKILGLNRNQDLPNYYQLRKALK